jgi:hypothetical protein
MKIEEQTGIRSAAETYREPWEPCSVREEIGMAVSYLGERLCYRVSFLLGGICKRCLLAAGDYWRAKGEGLGHVRRGLREDNWGISNVGKSHRTVVRKRSHRVARARALAIY